jgi:histidyl-tRNA synthetase
VAGSLFFRDIERFVSHKRVGGGEGRKQKIFLVQLGELAKRKSLGLLETLRVGGVEVRESLGRDSIKSQLKVAERVGARIALILGQKEALDGTIIVREVQSGIQETIPQDKLVEVLKAKLKK